MEIALSSTHVPANRLSKRLWISRTIQGFLLLFLLFDAVTKIIREPHVMEASAQMGFPPAMIAGIGVALLACTIVYVIPRTAILGALLLTAYLGGAVASQVRIAASPFSLVFPILFAILIWSELLLREERLRALLPLRD